MELLNFTTYSASQPVLDRPCEASVATPSCLQRLEGVASCSLRDIWPDMASKPFSVFTAWST